MGKFQAPPGSKGALTSQQHINSLILPVTFYSEGHVSRVKAQPLNGAELSLPPAIRSKVSVSADLTLWWWLMEPLDLLLTTALHPQPIVCSATSHVAHKSAVLDSENQRKHPRVGYTCVFGNHLPQVTCKHISQWGVL